MSSYLKFIYGIKIKFPYENYIECGSSKDYITYKNGENNLDRKQQFRESMEVTLNDYKNYSIYDVDFEYESYDDLYGGETILIGLNLGECKFLYSGCSEIPKISESEINDFNEFIKKHLSQFKCHPKIYVYGESCK